MVDKMTKRTLQLIYGSQEQASRGYSPLVEIVEEARRKLCDKVAHLTDEQIRDIAKSEGFPGERDGDEELCREYGLMPW
jgi:PP-loop superfamily ATP-utilizing enzyme